MGTAEAGETARAERGSEGVFYHRDDYAGLGRRFLIVVVDSIVCLAAGVAIFIVAALFSRDGVVPLGTALVWLGFIYAYLAILKSTPVPTLGYLLTGVRLVNMRGERPSFLRTSFRLLLWVLGPIHPLVDFVWLANDPNRQTLRDRFAATYVIRKDAKPAGRGRIALVPYFIWGMTLFFREIRRGPANEPQAPGWGRGIAGGDGES